MVRLGLAGGAFGPLGGSAPVVDDRRQLAQALAGIADDCVGESLHGIEPGDVDADEPGVGGERRPRTGGEVLQSGADGDDDIGLGGERVRRRAPGDADRPGVQRVGRQHDALPATVSTTGMLWISAKRVSSASAPE